MPGYHRISRAIRSQWNAISSAALLALALASTTGWAQTVSKDEATSVSPSGTERPFLPLPTDEGFPVDMDVYDNPLFLFQEGGTQRPTLDQLAPPRPTDLLQPLAPAGFNPFAPAAIGTDRVEEAKPEPPKPPPTLSPEERRLFELAVKIAPAVVAIKVWDEYGTLISSGVGSFISNGGLILTDTSVVHPEIAERVDYITTTAADGTNHRITGFYVADMASGVTLMQSEDQSATHLPIKTGVSFEKEVAVNVLAVSEKRGLVLADAKMVRDSALAGQGWFNIKGKDSPGAVGSPVLDRDGNLVGIVGMQVPLKDWMNFALAPDYAAYEIQRRKPALKPLSQLPRFPQISDVATDPEFVDAFKTLSEKRVESATSKFLKLTIKYPRSAECWALLGLAAARIGATPEAASCQRKAVALDPKTGLYWHQLAMTKLRLNQQAGATDTEDREVLERATEQRPGDQTAWLLLASHYLKDGDLDKADGALRQLVKQQPDYAQGFYLLAYVRGRLRNYTEAEAAIARCLELDARHADAWYYRGLLLSRRKEHTKAAEAFRAATRQRPDHPQAWLNLAHAYLRAHRDTEARLAFRQHQAISSRVATNSTSKNISASSSP